jgi:3',5'-cyclic AMP phosphodiesterase CpdA
MLIDRRSFVAAGVGATCLPWLAAQENKDPYADGILKAGEPPRPAADSFTIAVLPDTQHYSEKYPKTYLAQTEWIAKHRTARRIEGVLHLGDITNRNSVPEWKNASQAMAVLDDAKIPYAYCPGNHDYAKGGGGTDRTTLLNDHFPIERLRKQPTFGGPYDKEPTRTENSFHLWSIGGREFLILALEFGPRGDVLRWANEILTRHAKREVILITHAFIYFDDTRYDQKKYGAKQSWNPHAYGMAKATGDDVNDGEEIWQKLIAKHENVVLTLNGHVLGDGLGRFESTTPAGRVVPQWLVNFQMRPNGGDGWLRLLEFKADRTVAAIDYSPVLGQRNESAQNMFAAKLPSVGRPS